MLKSRSFLSLPRTSLAVAALLPLGVFAACSESDDGTSGNMQMTSSTTSSTTPPGTSPTANPTTPTPTGATGPMGNTGATGNTGGNTGNTGNTGGNTGNTGGNTGGAGAMPGMSGMGGSMTGAGGSTTGAGGSMTGAGGAGGSMTGAGGAGGMDGLDGMGGMDGMDGAGGMSGGGEFALTGPWSAKDDCTPENRDPCDEIPVENRATMIGGQNVMPTITWTPGPEGTQSYAVVYQDLSNGFSHWALWNIPMDVLSVGPDSIPAGASQAALVGDSWFGSGACENVYQLSVYALSEATFDPGGGQAHTAARDQLDGDDGTLVLATDYARVTPRPPCQ